MIPTIQNKKIVRGRAVPWVLGLFLAGTAIFAVFTAQTAHAQIDYEDPQNYDAPGTTAADTNPGPAQSVTPKTTTPAPPSTCGVLSLGACVSEALTNFARTIGNFILAAMSQLVWLAGKLLDMSMYFTIHMADILRQMNVVDAGWAVFRDLANMVFIFVLLYIAIATILNLPNTKQMLVSVIVTAFLINFSLFITKAIVDVSNVVALQFYDRLQSLPSNDPKDPYKGPSAALRNAMKIATIYSPNKATGDADATASSLSKELLTKSDEIGAFLIKIAMGSVVMLITAFIFATGAILLFIRIITLMFLMMISPLAFIARILPRTQSAWDQWWKALINNAIFAPVWLAMLYVVISTASNGLPGLPGDSNNANFSNVFSGESASLSVIFNYTFIIILLIGTIIVSKSIGLHGASAIMNTSKAAAKWVGTKTRQQGIGRPLRAITDSETFKSFARNNPRIGRVLYGAATTVTGSKAVSGGYDQYRAKKDAKTKRFVQHVGFGTPPPGPTPVPPVIPTGGSTGTHGGTPTPPASPQPVPPVVRIPGGPTGTTVGTGPGGRRVFNVPPSPTPGAVPPVIPPGGPTPPPPRGGTPGTPLASPPTAGAPSGGTPLPTPPAESGGAEEIVKAIKDVEKKIEKMTEKIEGMKEKGQNTTALEDTLKKLKYDLEDLKEIHSSVTQPSTPPQWTEYVAEQARKGVLKSKKVGKKTTEEMKDKFSELRKLRKEGASPQEIEAAEEELGEEIEE